jgi:protein involved in polysaccharide export with SLBB domain
MKMRKAEWCVSLVVVALVLLAAVGGAPAQTGPLGDTIQPGDVLQMMVPGRPDLDSALVVDQNGSVDIPQVGEVRLSGLSLGEAGVLLKQRLRLIAPTLDAVELDRAEAASFRVYVLGQVGNPGVHDFPRQPTVWDVLRAAGGPTPTADLREARVIREEKGQPGTVPLDLSRMLDGEDFPTISLRDGDTLVIPALAVGVSGVPSERGVKVFGGVAVPSVVQVDGPTLLMDVLMLAGSPTADANMKKIWWVHAVDGIDQAQVVNLRRFLEKGDPAGNPLIYPGDTVNVTLSQPGGFRTGFTFLASTASVLFLAFNRVR